MINSNPRVKGYTVLLFKYKV